MLEGFTVDTFSGRVGEPFRLDADGSRVDLTLVECTPLGGDGGARAPFSLVFLGGSDEVLPQRIYRFEHDELGAFDLFIVPIARDADGTQYEAVFT